MNIHGAGSITGLLSADYDVLFEIYFVTVFGIYIINLINQKRIANKLNKELNNGNVKINREEILVLIEFIGIMIFIILILNITTRIQYSKITEYNALNSSISNEITASGNEEDDDLFSGNEDKEADDLFQEYNQNEETTDVDSKRNDRVNE